MHVDRQRDRHTDIQTCSMHSQPASQTYRQTKRHGEANGTKMFNPQFTVSVWGESTRDWPPVDSPHKGPGMRKAFIIFGVIMVARFIPHYIVSYGITFCQRNRVHIFRWIQHSSLVQLVPILWLILWVNLNDYVSIENTSRKKNWLHMWSNSIFMNP